MGAKDHRRQCSQIKGWIITIQAVKSDENAKQKRFPKLKALSREGFFLFFA